ncbi:MAG: hypothetical protein HOJ51_00935 [Tateyamaria sp.]|nr:hypothetical protein [Tateyamaria sp.]MBT6341969.1 hypothetical protein [Tateyamaria sp.]
MSLTSFSQWLLLVCLISHLSYPECGSCAIQGQSLGTTFMLGDDEGRIVSRSAVIDRGGVRSAWSERILELRTRMIKQGGKDI